MKTMIKLSIALVFMALTGCGTTICYTDPGTGIRVCEVIDGVLAPVIEINYQK